MTMEVNKNKLQSLTSRQGGSQDRNTSTLSSALPDPSPYYDQAELHRPQPKNLKMFTPVISPNTPKPQILYTPKVAAQKLKMKVVGSPRINPASNQGLKEWDHDKSESYSQSFCNDQDSQVAETQFEQAADNIGPSPSLRSNIQKDLQLTAANLKTIFQYFSSEKYAGDSKQITFDHMTKVQRFMNLKEFVQFGNKILKKKLFNVDGQKLIEIYRKTAAQRDRMEQKEFELTLIKILQYHLQQEIEQIQIDINAVQSLLDSQVTDNQFKRQLLLQRRNHLKFEQEQMTEILDDYTDEKKLKYTCEALLNLNREWAEVEHIYQLDKRKIKDIRLREEAKQRHVRVKEKKKEQMSARIQASNVMKKEEQMGERQRYQLRQLYIQLQKKQRIIKQRMIAETKLVLDYTDRVVENDKRTDSNQSLQDQAYTNVKDKQPEFDMQYLMSSKSRNDRRVQDIAQKNMKVKKIHSTMNQPQLVVPSEDRSNQESTEGNQNEQQMIKPTKRYQSVKIGQIKKSKSNVRNIVAPPNLKVLPRESEYQTGKQVAKHVRHKSTLEMRRESSNLRQRESTKGYQNVYTDKNDTKFNHNKQKQTANVSLPQIENDRKIQLHLGHYPPQNIAVAPFGGLTPKNQSQFAKKNFETHVSPMNSKKIIINQDSHIGGSQFSNQTFHFHEGQFTNTATVFKKTTTRQTVQKIKEGHEADEVEDGGRKMGKGKAQQLLHDDQIYQQDLDDGDDFWFGGTVHQPLEQSHSAQFEGNYQTHDNRTANDYSFISSQIKNVKIKSKAFGIPKQNENLKKGGIRSYLKRDLNESLFNAFQQQRQKLNNNNQLNQVLPTLKVIK